MGVGLEENLSVGVDGGADTFLLEVGIAVHPEKLRLLRNARRDRRHSFDEIWK